MTEQMTSADRAAVRQRFRGKRVLLTGALGSLGRAQAAAFAGEGASVVALDRPELADDAAALLAVLGEGHRFIGQDLDDLDATAETVARIAGDAPVDVLVNNAALIINRPFEDFAPAEFEAQMRVNASAAFVLARAVAPGMKARGTGAIVNFCSLVLNGRWDGYVPYTASKGAMLGLTKSLARELGPHGIRVNAVSPGAVVSEAEERVFGDRLQAYHDWILENQCLKRRIAPEAVASLVLFLASADADMITGQNVGVDGGW